MPLRSTFRPRNISCTFQGCSRQFTNSSGLTQHYNSAHTLFHESRNARRHSPVPRIGGPRASPVEGGGDAAPDAEFRPGLLHRRVERHPVVNGRKCNREGKWLPSGAPPAPPEDLRPPDDYSPYNSAADFHLADLLYRKVQMSAGAIDELMQNWASRDDAPDPPFADHKDLYSTIDATGLSHVPWQSFEVSYNQPVAVDDTTPWKRKSYTVYFRDPHLILQQQLANPDFKHDMDFAPKRVFAADGTREYMDFMSGNWAWRQADNIAKLPGCRGVTFVPAIMGSDKTTVSVATGQNEYYPLYLSNGLVHNNIRRAHGGAVTLIGFLAIPKTDREHQNSVEFRTFRRNLFHGSLRIILGSLLPGMTQPEVTLFGDGYYRRVIYGLGPYIADYPEQVLLACVVQGWCARCTASNKDLDGHGGRRSQQQTEALFEAFSHKTLWDDYGIIPDVLPFTWDFPRADIHELLSPDLLHQVIKGTFKDHLVTWVGEYLKLIHGAAEAKKIMADIDRRIAAIPPFSGLRQFPEGRGFKQWTGDDSKALMKVRNPIHMFMAPMLAQVYLPAVEGHVPAQMLRALSAFLDFCYLVRWNVIGERTLHQIDDALARFHRERMIFVESGVCPNGFCLPRQHALTHYRRLIQEFGAPNGLCSSITESKHIKAVKEPWRRSSRYEALSQMLTINDRLNKLSAARSDFKERGMSTGPATRAFIGPIGLPAPQPQVAAQQADEDDDVTPTDEREILGEVKLARTPIRQYPRDPERLAHFLNLPTLPLLLRRFLYAQAHPDLDIPLETIPLDECPELPSRIMAYPSATATFYAPSDQSGLGGQLRERIRAVRSWRGGPARYDCVFVEEDADQPGFRGLLAARVLLFFSFKHNGVVYPCAAVTWFSTVGESPCPDVGMWMVEPDLDGRGRRVLDIIHLDSILRGAHLIPIYGDSYLPRHIKRTASLDSFRAYYVNKYADHHSHEIAF
ncbi:hypothetical protein DFH08DRAFT_791300 [Mycena albidolilacea]|uniref:C2H2-type domain-containing protein n=1 Tax=Mycena albidolilacea TaxID=1033008 RepID=A0AAD6Z980_9AGAR|nr:hypothetical protein DFH08DRAFT_791300 [Mycena albidolilacea]